MAIINLPEVKLKILLQFSTSNNERCDLLSVSLVAAFDISWCFMLPYLIFKQSVKSYTFTLRWDACVLSIILPIKLAIDWGCIRPPFLETAA